MQRLPPEAATVAPTTTAPPRRSRPALGPVSSDGRGLPAVWRTRWHDVAMALVSGRTFLPRVRNLLAGARLRSCLDRCVPVVRHLVVLIGNASSPLKSHESGQLDPEVADLLWHVRENGVDTAPSHPERDICRAQPAGERNVRCMVTPADGGQCQAAPSLEGPENEYGLGFLAKHSVKAISRTSQGVGPLVRRRGGAARAPRMNRACCCIHRAY